ncbi:hypothetical protein CHCC14564_4307 [Bacillus licheniformis LMG 17339]|nr:hypothetical protein CHCC14564_4307 [Bacillus licheniformis LMG 17339]
MNQRKVHYIIHLYDFSHLLYIMSSTLLLFRASKKALSLTEKNLSLYNKIYIGKVRLF